MITLTEYFLMHHEDCNHLKERDLLKAINTPCHDECQWYEISAEIFPCKVHWRQHRWFVEIHSRPTNWPKADDPPVIFTHYHTFDKSTWTLRGAWFKADKQMWKLNDYLQDNPEERPTP